MPETPLCSGARTRLPKNAIEQLSDVWLVFRVNRGERILANELIGRITPTLNDCRAGINNAAIDADQSVPVPALLHYAPEASLAPPQRLLGLLMGINDDAHKANDP